MTRDFLASGKAEVISPEEREKALKSLSIHSHTCSEFDCAMKIGEITGADYVIYGILERMYKVFQFQVTIIQLPSGILEKSLKRKFSENSIPSDIAKEVSVVSDTFLDVIPLYHNDSPDRVSTRSLPGEVTVDSLLERVVIDQFPDIGEYGPAGAILNYNNIFPGAREWEKFSANDVTELLNFFKHLGDQTASSMSELYSYVNFFKKFDLDTYAIKNCSIGALDMLLAHEIPVLMVYRGNVRVLTGYSGLPENENSYYYLDGGEILPIGELGGMELRGTLFAVNKPGRFRGHSQEKLSKAIERFKDTWNDTPELINIEE